MALREAAAQGHSAQGATAYVTLEPCCDALMAAVIRAVVATRGTFICNADQV